MKIRHQDLDEIFLINQAVLQFVRKKISDVRSKLKSKMTTFGARPPQIAWDRGGARKIPTITSGINGSSKEEGDRRKSALYGIY